MLTITERHLKEATILDLNGTLLVPGDDVALVDVVSRCAASGSRVVMLNVAGLVRIDAAGLGALIRSRNVLASRGAELRLLNPTRLVEDLLRRTKVDSVIPTVHVEPGDHDPSGNGGPARRSAVATAIAAWRDAFVDSTPTSSPVEELTDPTVELEA